MAAIITFLQNAIRQGICILFGANGEILTEKSGNLNLGVPGMMYMGGIAGLAAAFLYERASGAPNAALGFLLALAAVVAWRFTGGSRFRATGAGSVDAASEEGAAGRPEIAPYHEGAAEARKRVPPGADEFISVVVAVEVANPQMSLLYESAASCLWQAP